MGVSVTIIDSLMGFLWKSESEQIAEQIREQAKFILQQFNGIDEVFSRDGGATPYNMEELSLYMQRIERYHEAIQVNLNKLSASQQGRLVLPWVNGRYYDLQAWNFSYMMVINKIIQELNKV